MFPGIRQNHADGNAEKDEQYGNFILQSQARHQPEPEPEFRVVCFNDPHYDINQGDPEEVVQKNSWSKRNT